MPRKVKPGKTLPDLGAKVGSRVYFDHPDFDSRGDVYTIECDKPHHRSGLWTATDGDELLHREPYWHFAPDDPQAEPVLWRDDTPENKGAVLLALHENRPVEFWFDGRWVEIKKTEDAPKVFDGMAYRVKPPAPPTTDIIITYTGNVIAEQTENLHLRRITLPLDAAGNAITGTFTDDAGNQIIIEDTSHD